MKVKQYGLTFLVVKCKQITVIESLPLLFTISLPPSPPPLSLSFSCVSLVPSPPLSYDWFEGLGLRWYGLPAVSNVMLDMGGVEYPAAPFSGWYMGTEIGRDLGDINRYNMLKVSTVCY